jgi:hypothetical protein
VTVIIEKLRQRFYAANALRAAYRVAHGEDDSPEYARLADDSSDLLFALLMARLREVQL